MKHAETCLQANARQDGLRSIDRDLTRLSAAAGPSCVQPCIGNLQGPCRSIMESRDTQDAVCVLVQVPRSQILLEQLQERYKVIQLWEHPDITEVAPSIRVLIASKETVPRELLDSLPHLGIIANHGVGVDHIDLDYCQSRGICVTNTPDIVTDDAADLAILLMLAVLRHLCPAHQFVRDGLWPHQALPLAKKASGLRIGILGLGKIGMAIARRAEGFDSTIAYHGSSRKPGVSYTYYSELIDLATNSDVLIVACRLSDETKHVVGREVLDALGPEGTLVNIARGAVVDEEELVKALVEKRLGAAGLDVFENEPYVPAELLKMDNVVLSPHAGTTTWETRRAIAKLILDNIHAFLSGQPLLTPLV